MRQIKINKQHKVTTLGCKTLDIQNGMMNNQRHIMLLPSGINTFVLPPVGVLDSLLWTLNHTFLKTLSNGYIKIQGY